MLTALRVMSSVGEVGLDAGKETSLRKERMFENKVEESERASRWE